MTADIDTLLDATTRTLVDRFGGVIDPDTVGRYVHDSYVTLHRTAFADPQLPDLAQRFAVDRLTALAQHTGRLESRCPRCCSSASTTRAAPRWPPP
jgi:arsenate reductase (thioredoxin)